MAATRLAGETGVDWLVEGGVTGEACIRLEKQRRGTKKEDVKEEVNMITVFPGKVLRYERYEVELSDSAPLNCNVTEYVGSQMMERNIMTRQIMIAYQPRRKNRGAGDNSPRRQRKWLSRVVAAVRPTVPHPKYGKKPVSAVSIEKRLALVLNSSRVICRIHGFDRSVVQSDRAHGGGWDIRQAIGEFSWRTAYPTHIGDLPTEICHHMWTGRSPKEKCEYSLASHFVVHAVDPAPPGMLFGTFRARLGYHKSN